MAKKLKEIQPDRILLPGKPDYEQCDNKVVSARYTLVTFFPVAIMEQFRRFANVYFLVVGSIMAIGWYGEKFESAISPWTTLGPLALVISVSLLVEGTADYKRHVNDDETNNASCVILRRGDELDAEMQNAANSRGRNGRRIRRGTSTPVERDDKIMRGRDVIVNINKAFYDENKTVHGNRNGNKQKGGTATPAAAAAATTTASTPAAAAPTPPLPTTTTTTTTTTTAINVKVGFQKIRRMDIRQGHFVLVKNREMVPADMVLMASSNDGGSAYIETSSIDGETNLKMRLSPQLPKSVLKALRSNMVSIPEDSEANNGHDDDDADAAAGTPHVESIEDATKRLTRFSYLGRPEGESVLCHPYYDDHVQPSPSTASSPDRQARKRLHNVAGGIKSGAQAVRKAGTEIIHIVGDHSVPLRPAHDGRYIAALTTEPPNPSVHTFTGKLTLPPFDTDGECLDLALGAENVLLRGAVIRNTEWVIGIAFFTGKDTKLIQNSFDTPSKFSQLDVLMNKTVVVILCIMFTCIVCLSSLAVSTNAVEFEDLWYIGINKNITEPWPYLPDLAVPQWETESTTWIQYFFLYVTLLNNFVPLSLYVTVELITFCMIFFIYSDLEMYDATSNTRAVARSTIVTDLGRIQYIFSDKTGTLTQNVMRFKRCSVDGMAFGTPIQKANPREKAKQAAAAASTAAPASSPTSLPTADEQEEDEEMTSFHPLRQLLVGQFQHPTRKDATLPSGLEGLGGGSTFANEDDDASIISDKLTFNAEMFLRAMSLCHTVVVEKDLDKMDRISGSTSVSSNASGMSSLKDTASAVKQYFNRRNRKSRGGGGVVVGVGSPLSAVSEDGAFELNSPGGALRPRTASTGSLPPGPLPSKSPDGAPYGFAYQAESIDEGALVSAASKTYGFQVINRDSNSIKIRVCKPSHFQDPDVVDGLRSGKLTLKKLAAQTASEIDADTAPSYTTPDSFPDPSLSEEQREESWTILAVNKFDSDRKRMSILLRSPPELGSLPILFCKGADSAMLDPSVCSSTQLLQPAAVTGGDDVMQALRNSAKPPALKDGDRDVSALTTVSEDDEAHGESNIDTEGWELAQMLGIQAHLGDFAKEGLRTLVLGMRIVPEEECEAWLEQYKQASISLTNRETLLKQAGLEIERDLHIAGATAIEDKLQRGVPETIATLGKAGIKLWVLTGDKRETAVEIGYSTHVLSPKMHVTEVGDLGKHHVRTQMSMEFLRLVKRGKLPQFQKSVVDSNASPSVRQCLSSCWFRFGKFVRGCQRSRLGMWAAFLDLIGAKFMAQQVREKIVELKEAEGHVMRDIDRRRAVRNRADRMIKLWLESDEGKAQRRKVASHDDDDELSLTSEETPMVFNRASSAKTMLKNMRQSGRLSQAELRKFSIAHLTAQQAGGGDDEPLVDEDALSLQSFFPENVEDLNGNFDRKRRTLLERMFAIDRQVRKGQLTKHLFKEKRQALHDKVVQPEGGFVPHSSDGPRALVIEGAAIKHLFGDPELEEMLFAVASSCEAVIACRVSPKQKAQLVNLVRHNVKPTPITLAIGDGANDVGMIQEAHVGVGISGKEGQQAVNASDFAIAQFRFLESLVLIHGRWNFFRLSTVVMFSFYKNAVMAGVLIVFASRTVYSGTPLYDQWLIAMLNFVAGIPIIMTGLFDRCLSKDYVRAHPEVYKATRENELITFRTLARWFLLVFVHLFTLYFMTVPQQSYGGGTTSAFIGLMRNNPGAPGDGEGSDLKSVGTVTFTCMVFLLAYKVLYESRSLVHGRWPAFTCRKNVGEGVMSRLAYTWIGVTWFSIIFYLWALVIYQLIGRIGANSLSRFVDTANHVLGMRSLSWMLILFVPIIGMVFDVTAKVFSNMYYPTQTQIHLEMESKSKRERKMQRFIDSGMRRKRRAHRDHEPEDDDEEDYDDKEKRAEC